MDDALLQARHAVRDSTHPAILLGRDYRILAANKAYRARYTGSANGGSLVLGEDRCHWVSHRYDGPCDRHGEACPLQAALQTGEASRVLHIHHCTSGPEHVDVLLRPVRDASNAIIAFIETIRTVTSASTGAGPGDLLGVSPAFNAAIGAVRRVARSNLSVLLTGESGTGKELFARAIHSESPRAKGPFIPVECSGLTESLFESELFGHEAGAFTGARSRRDGLVEAARGGTLFLDEIGDVPLPLQVKLLRLLERRTFRRVGSVDEQHADFRLVAATHRDLGQAIAEGSFRLDLYYRINGFPLQVPALRDRLDDLPVLCRHFLRDSGKHLTPDAEALLASQAFPGNIRELKNALRRGALMADGKAIHAHHLLVGPPSANKAPRPEDIIPLDEAERRYLRWAANHHQGERSELADKLGISVRTLYRKLGDL